jgi:hypothetical protein
MEGNGIGEKQSEPTTTSRKDETCLSVGMNYTGKRPGVSSVDIEKGEKTNPLDCRYHPPSFPHVAL